MSNLPEGLAQFEYQKMQLIGSLGAVAETMRNCAAIAEQFASLVSQVPYNHPINSNGQFAVPPAVPALPPTGRGKRKAGEEVEGPKSKRARKPKDPNAPKRPASSYLLFQNEIRQDLKAKNPTLPNNELLGVIAKMWKDMPKPEKDAYEARQKIAKDHWLAEKTAYTASKSEEPPVLSPVPHPKPIVQKVEAPETSDEETSDGDDESSSSSDSSVDRKVVAPKKSKKSAASHTAAKGSEKVKTKA